MDNTAQNQNNQDVGSQTLQPSQPVQQQVQQDEKIISGQNQYTPGASSVNKEKGVASAFSENIKPTEEDVRLEDDVKNAGVSVVSDKPKLDEIHEQIGVVHSAESTPVKTEPTGNISLPMSEDEARETVKMKQSKFNIHENVGEFAGEYTEDSKPFLAALIVKVFKEMHRRVFSRKK